MSAVVMKCILLLSAICYSVAQEDEPVITTAATDPISASPGAPPAAAPGSPDKDGFDCGQDFPRVNKEFKKLRRQCIDKTWPSDPDKVGFNDKKCCHILDEICFKTRYFLSQKCKLMDELVVMKRWFNNTRDNCRTEANVTLTDQLCASLRSTPSEAECRPTVGCLISDTLFGTSPGIQSPDPTLTPGAIKNTGARHTCALSLVLILVVIAFIRI